MKPVLVGVVLGLIAASCGGGGDEADELAEAFADQIMEQVQADEDDAPLPIERSEADCLGRAVVNTIGYDAFADAGITAETVRAGDETNPFEELDLDPEKGDALFAAMEGCVDFAAALAESQAADMDISVSSAECVIAGFLEIDAFRDAITAGIVGSEDSVDPFQDPSSELVGAMFDLLNDCLTDEELARMLEG